MVLITRWGDAAASASANPAGQKPRRSCVPIPLRGRPYWGRHHYHHLHRAHNSVEGKATKVSSQQQQVVNDGECTSCGDGPAIHTYINTQRNHGWPTQIPPFLGYDVPSLDVELQPSLGQCTSLDRFTRLFFCYNFSLHTAACRSTSWPQGFRGKTRVQKWCSRI